MFGHLSKYICSNWVNVFPRSTLLRRQLLPQNCRTLSDQTGNLKIQTSEARIREILSKRFPSAEYIEVTDASGGCGAMYEIAVVAGEFKGLTIVKQHRLVNEALKEEIKDMHGLRIHTALPGNPS
ncbi:bolA-like protein 3 [Macrosteles quadrilineatus]|uniref:bolA-like protein 3 n=1 Tax=Macrosteles quadrilineatus TaxID=74068 RepID=UPI0023E22E7C|nr:bolA-like protein 3 [Macrosteles quadrilineatus]